MWKEYYNFYLSGFTVFAFPMCGLIFVGIGSFVTKAIRNGDLDLETFSLEKAYLFRVFGLIWTTIAFLGIGYEYIKFLSVMVSEKYHITEGIVTNFHPQHGRTEESFVVNNIKFSYSSSTVSLGFNKSKPKKGPIDSGKLVKIYYYDNTILKLWVKE